MPYRPMLKSLPLENRTREMVVGCPRNKRESCPCKEERNEVLGMWSG